MKKIKEIKVNGEIVDSPRTAMKILAAVCFAARGRYTVTVDGIDRSASFRRASILTDKLIKEVVNNHDFFGAEGHQLYDAAFEAIANAAADSNN